MEEARKKLRLCLILVVTAAVIVGMLYYFGDIKNGGDMSEGTLVRQEEDNLKTASAVSPGGSYGIWQ